MCDARFVGYMQSCIKFLKERWFELKFISQWKSVLFKLISWINRTKWWSRGPGCDLWSYPTPKIRVLPQFYKILIPLFRPTTVCQDSQGDLPMNLSRLAHKLTHESNSIDNVWSCNPKMNRFTCCSLVLINILKQGSNFIS